MQNQFDKSSSQKLKLSGEWKNQVNSASNEMVDSYMNFIWCTGVLIPKKHLIIQATSTQVNFVFCRPSL